VSRRKSPKGLCVYCGVNPATTRDHVIPECLFVPPLPSNMVTVPACADCNNTKKSQDDPYLRDMLVYDNDSSRHVAARELFRGKVMRAARTNRSDVTRATITAARRGMEPRHSSGGLYLGHYYPVDLDATRFDRSIFSTIVKGLYYKVCKERLPDGCDVRDRPPRPAPC